MATKKQTKPIEHIEVESSNIKSIGYDPATKTLEVIFLKGSKYSYQPVSQASFDEFKHAESKGKYFYNMIRTDKKIKTTKLS